VVIFDLLAELEKRDCIDDAAFLRAEMEKKAEYFVCDDPYPFRSEYSFDSTGFESSAALATWTLTGMDLLPKKNLWYDENRERWMSHTDVGNLLSWQHSGFSLHGDVRVPDRDAAARLGRYMIRCPTVLERLSLDEDTGEVLYRTRPSRAAHPEGPVARWDV
jgi:hypothetical protein